MRKEVKTMLLAIPHPDDEVDEEDEAEGIDDEEEEEITHEDEQAARYSTPISLQLFFHSLVIYTSLAHALA